MFFLIVSVLLVFYTLCQPLVSQTLRFTYPVKGKGVVFTSCSLYLKKKFQYCLQHFLSQIILVVFLNFASVKKLHFSKKLQAFKPHFKHFWHIFSLFQNCYFEKCKNDQRGHNFCKSICKTAHLILMFLKHNWLIITQFLTPQNHLGNSRKCVTCQLGGNADSLAPPALLSQNLHFTTCTLLQLLVDFPRWRDAAEPGAQSHYLTLVVECLVTYMASWLGSFTCMSLFNPEICPLKQAFLEDQKSCHWACKSVTERQFLESVFPKPEKGKLRHRLWWPDQV